MAPHALARFLILTAAFYYPALKPWVHYVPVGWNGEPEETDNIVQFLRDNDELARTIAANGQRFANEHLNEEGRLCYIKACVAGMTWLWQQGKTAVPHGAVQVLFEEMRKLMQYLPPPPSAFPHIISFAEEVETHLKPYWQHIGGIRVRDSPGM